MAVFVRSRRVTDPFNEKLRERIFGFRCSEISNASIISGSDHDADNDVVSSSSSSSSSYSECPCLSELVQNFLEDADGAVPTCAGGDPAAAEAEDVGDLGDRYLASDTAALIEDVICRTAWSNGDRFRTDLFAHVARAAETFSLFRRNNSAFNRNVMAYLRQIGYNAGACKTKWDATPGGSLAAGSYEFIDVVRPSPEPKSIYIIDLDFAGQFEIARATENYRRLLSSLPRVFVGNSDDLKKIVRIMADEAKRSMKINGMSLPPWRKNRYMQLKWFGPYRRTVNQLPTSSILSPQTVKCRSVGFFTSATDGGGNLVVVPSETRTR